MIIYENKGFETRSDMPDLDWTGNALFVVSDRSHLAQKIIELYPCYDFVTDEEGKLIDVVATERPPEPEQDPEPTTQELLNGFMEGFCL